MTADAFCKTSKAAKMEKMASCGAICVNKDRSETLIKVVDKAMAGDRPTRKTPIDRWASKKVATASKADAATTARRSPPNFANKGPISEDWTTKLKTRWYDWMYPLACGSTRYMSS